MFIMTTMVKTIIMKQMMLDNDNKLNANSNNVYNSFYLQCIH